MEDGDSDMSIDAPPPAGFSFAIGMGGNSGAPGRDEDESDTESVFSDASTEILVDEDEQEVVPPSFTLPTPVHPQLNDDEELLEPPQPVEERPLRFIVVHGSDSKC